MAPANRPVRAPAGVYTASKRDKQRGGDTVTDEGGAMAGVVTADLIARAPEAQKSAHDLTPQEMAELIFAVGRGMLMRDVLQPPELTSEERRARQLEVTRGLWRLLFQPENAAAYA